jgi:hypothetical protein
MVKYNKPIKILMIAGLQCILVSSSFALDRNALKPRSNINASACRPVSIRCYNRHDNRVDLGIEYTVTRMECPPQRIPRRHSECTQAEMDAILGRR